jgi:NAD+ synthetase
MRIALGQFDATVGDLAGNAAAIERLAADALAGDAELLLLPELCLLGYPPRDLLLREEVVPACETLAENLAARLPLPTLIGLPRRVQGGSRPIANSVALCRGGRIEGWHDKILLPTYDVFDENRWFQSGSAPFVFDLGGKKMGVLVCEDLWRAEDVGVDRPYLRDPVGMAIDVGCDFLLSPSASPFVESKHAKHTALLADIARSHGVFVAMANQVGANDDLVFDGGSAVFSPMGRCIGSLPRFEEGLAVVDTNAIPSDVVPMESDHERFCAIVAAIRGYCTKTGQPGVVLGASGGIDSAVTAALAVAALGPENVELLLMPSRYSSDGSLNDARDLAERLGITSVLTIPIESLHTEVGQALAGGELEGLTDENVQARLRGLLLMARSNQTGRMVLAPSNKSELAVGYSTLYGDMNGGMMPLGDCYKTEVVSLGRWMMANHAGLGFSTEPIPEASLSKPPSAELRPDQLDEDSLPPYDVLDAVLRMRIDEERSPEAIQEALGVAADLVARIDRMHARSEFKRYQSTIIPKLSPRSFGRGRQLPLAARWTPTP